MSAIYNNGITHARMDGNLPQESNIHRRPSPSPDYICEDVFQETLSSTSYNLWQSRRVPNDDRMFAADIRHGGVGYNGDNNDSFDPTVTGFARKGVPLAEQDSQLIYNDETSTPVEDYPRHTHLPDLGFTRVVSNGDFENADERSQTIPQPYPSYLLSRMQMLERDNAGFTAYNLHARADQAAIDRNELQLANFNSANGVYAQVDNCYETHKNKFVFDDEVP